MLRLGNTCTAAYENSPPRSGYSTLVSRAYTVHLKIFLRFILAFLQSVVATGLFMRVLEWERLRTSRHASYLTSDNFNNSSKYLSFRIVFELSGKYHAG